jgi:uncharacterized membrane protein
MQSKFKTIYLVQGAMIAAMYVILALIFRTISYGMIQVRIAEALMILPAFTPAAIPGLFIGCLIANVLSPSPNMFDIVFGSGAFWRICSVRANGSSRFRLSSSMRSWSD